MSSSQPAIQLYKDSSKLTEMKIYSRAWWIDRIRECALSKAGGTNKSVGGITKFHYPFMGGGGSPNSRYPLWGGGVIKTNFKGSKN